MKARKECFYFHPVMLYSENLSNEASNDLFTAAVNLCCGQVPRGEREPVLFCVRGKSRNRHALCRLSIQSTLRQACSVHSKGSVRMTAHIVIQGLARVLDREGSTPAA